MSNIKLNKLSFLFGCFFLFGFLTQPFIYKVYKLFFINKNFSVAESKNIGSETCLPEEIKLVPKKSIIIIGHAYGSHKGSELRGNKSISPGVRKFYELNKENIDAIIFSGDVLKNPSLKRWNSFYSIFDKRIKIFIAPGNHDVGEINQKTKRDVFNLINHSDQFKKDFPFSVAINNQAFIIDDSNVLNYSLDKIFTLAYKLKNFQSVFIIRHHILPKSLSAFGNTKDTSKTLIDEELNIRKKFSPNQNVTFIYGDGGALKRLPRIACKKIDNINHLVNGVGERDNDIILVVNENKIFMKYLN